MSNFRTQKTWLVGASLLTAMLAGCRPDPDMPMRQQSAASNAVAAQDNRRITVTRIGVFKDDLAYNSRRGVYSIIDTKTGKEYIGISGIGIQETGSHAAGKTTVSDER